ncbi:MAG: DUF4010 domain-containing protein, partial [Bdellovibrionaceae bacterium]|nr:DUF4010 domain-containing protein [Pseudobdellovibrionaceae bacterium]
MQKTKNLERWSQYKSGLMAVVFIVFLASVMWLLPEGTLDPWGLFSAKKIVKLILSLVVIQTIAEVFVMVLGHRTGVLAAGFLSGLISSTALTVNLARKTKTTSYNLNLGAITLLSGTLAMLLEAAALIVIG